MQRLAVVLVVALTSCAASPPTVAYSSETPADVVDLADGVFTEFAAAFPGQAECIGRVEVHGKWELDDRARYLPDSRIIELRIPATAALLTSSLLHELGHHVAFACDSHLEIREEFAAAVGAQSWHDPTDYEHDPAELWAEAVVRHVTGRPDARRILTVPSAAVEVVADWSRG